MTSIGASQPVQDQVEQPILHEAGSVEDHPFASRMSPRIETLEDMTDEVRLH